MEFRDINVRIFPTPNLDKSTRVEVVAHCGNRIQGRHIDVMDEGADNHTLAEKLEFLLNEISEG